MCCLFKILLYLCDVEILKIEFMKTIFNVYVPMQDQAQCDRMKQVCVDNGLPIWKHSIAFEFNSDNEDYFRFNNLQKHFAIYNAKNKNKVTEAEFINLLKDYKNGK